MHALKPSEYSKEHGLWRCCSARPMPPRLAALLSCVVCCSRGEWYPVSSVSVHDGRVCEEMLRKHLFPPGTDSLALMCGPPGMQVISLAPSFYLICCVHSSSVLVLLGHHIIECIAGVYPKRLPVLCLCSRTCMPAVHMVCAIIPFGTF